MQIIRLDDFIRGENLIFFKFFVFIVIIEILFWLLWTSIVVDWRNGLKKIQSFSST